MKKSKEKKEDSVPERMAVVYGPPPRPPAESKLTPEMLNIADFQSVPSAPSVSPQFSPIPPPTNPPKKSKKSKDEDDNPNDRTEVYGPPPPSGLFD